MKPQRAGSSEAIKPFWGKETPGTQDRVVGKRTVTFAENEAVPGFHFGVVRIDVKNPVVQDPKHVERGMTTSRMLAVTCRALEQAHCADGDSVRSVVGHAATLDLQVHLK